MRKQIKYSLSFIIIILLILGFSASAENDTETRDNSVACTMDAKACPDGSFVGRIGPNCEFAKCPIASNDSNGVNVNENSKAKDDLQIKRDAYKTKINQLIDLTKKFRDGFRKELDAQKEQSKLSLEQFNKNFEERLSKINNENKKATAKKILENINKINLNKTDHFSNKIDQIENVLLSINSRITKVENKITDLSTLSTKISKAEKSISIARESIKKQSGKIYFASGIINDEAGLKSEILKLRDEFHADMVKLNNEVKLAHSAVSDITILLAKIPDVNEDLISNSDNNDNSTNN